MTLYVFGSNAMSQLGLPEDVSSTHRPVVQEFFQNKNIVKIAAGKLHSLVLCENNELYSWGVNDDCALGREGNENVPEAVTFTQRIVDICCGVSYSALLTDKGQVFACGTFKSTSGVFGFDQHSKFQPVLKRIEGLRGIAKIFSGDNHLIMTDRTGNLWTVGANEAGQLGRRHRERNVKRCLGATQVSAATRRNEQNSFVRAAGGGSHSHAINANMECFGWGSNYNGQLGVGSTETSPERKRVLLENVVDVSSGFSHSVFLTADGQVFGSGDNTMSQLGMEGVRMTEVPRKILDGVRIVAAGCDFCIACKENKLLSWGSNMNGELGIDEMKFDEVKAPTEIDFEFGVVLDVKCGNDFVLVLTG